MINICFRFVARYRCIVFSDLVFELGFIIRFHWVWDSLRLGSHILWNFPFLLHFWKGLKGTKITGSVHKTCSKVPRFTKPVYTEPFRGKLKNRGYQFGRVCDYGTIYSWYCSKYRYIKLISIKLQMLARIESLDIIGNSPSGTGIRGLYKHHSQRRRRTELAFQLEELAECISQPWILDSNCEISIAISAFKISNQVCD